MNPILLTLMAAFIFLMIPLTIYFLFIRTCGSAQGSGQGHSSYIPTGAHSHGAQWQQWQQWRPQWAVLIFPLHFTRVTATSILGYVHIPPATIVRVQRVFRRFSMASHGPSNHAEANRYELSFGFGLPPGSTAGIFNPACPPDILPAHVAAEAGISRYKSSPGIGAAAEGPPTPTHPTTVSASGPSRPAAAHIADAF